MSFVQIYRLIVYTLTLHVVLHLRMRRCEDSVCVFINHDLGERMRIQNQRLSTRVSVEPLPRSQVWSPAPKSQDENLQN